MDLAPDNSEEEYKLEADPVPPDFARLAQLAREFVEQGYKMEEAVRMARQKLASQAAK